MSIAEKLSTVAENIPKVYKAGQASMVDESKIIEKNVSGAFISVDDVSEIPHKVGCKVSGVDDPTSVKVTRCGKNLIPYPYSQTTQTTNGITFTDNGDGSITISGKAEKDAYFYLCVVDFGSDNMWNDSANNNGYYVSGCKHFFYNKTNKISAIIIPSGTDYSTNTITVKPQIEFGTEATDYAPYNGQTFTPNADGTVEGMTSLSPYMNVFTDNADVTLDVTYRKSWGMQTEYDRFWDVYLKSNNYTAKFAGHGWTKETFKPNRDIRPTNATQMFARGSLLGEDLVSLCEPLGIVVDFSDCTTFTEVFYYTGLSRVGVVDTRKATALPYIFAYSLDNLKTIDLLILKDDGSQTFTNNSFIKGTGLTSITIQGTIGQNGFNVQWSTKLSHDSVVSIINALSNTTTGLTVTFSLAAVNKAFETSEGANDGSTSAEWQALIGTKPNWTISLV